MRKIMGSVFRKIKKRRILVISAGGLKGGLQCLYFTVSGEAWEIIAHAYIPYPQKIAALLDQISDTLFPAVSAADLAFLDYRLSTLYTESAKTTLVKLPTALRTPHLAVLNRPCLWKGPTGEDIQQLQWNLTLGDAQHLSCSLGIPVLTDLIRHRCIAGGQAALPTYFGNLKLAAPVGGIVHFINIGLVSRITIVDTRKPEILVDSDTGPGTSCINSVMQRLVTESNNEGFDRDGTLAAQGTVNGGCLQELSEDSWFLKPAPKQASPSQFDPLIQSPCFTVLSENDRIATITALTARTLYNFYRREFKDTGEHQTVILSGGGANNQTLVRFLSTYFDTIPVENIEKFGIPVDMRIPLALGLTVNAFIGGTAIPWETGSNPTVHPLGKWILP